jgi:hypothetical protein
MRTAHLASGAAEAPQVWGDELMTDPVVDNVAVAEKHLAYLYKPVSQRRLSDYQDFFDSLADEVILAYAAPGGAGSIDGKQAVVGHITNLFSTLAAEVDDDTELASELEFFSNGADCVVVLWVECTRSKKTGVAANFKEVAVVLDFRDGLVARIMRFSQ